MYLSAARRSFFGCRSSGSGYGAHNLNKDSFTQVSIRRKTLFCDLAYHTQREYKAVEKI